MVLESESVELMDGEEAEEAMDASFVVDGWMFAREEPAFRAGMWSVS